MAGSDGWKQYQDGGAILAGRSTQQFHVGYHVWAGVGGGGISSSAQAGGGPWLNVLL